MPTSITKTPAIISLVFLTMAVLGRWPYVFYILLRFVVCGSGLYLAFRAYELRKSIWVWLMGGIAVLFNPLVPIGLRRSDWQILDVVAAVVSAVSIFAIKK